MRMESFKVSCERLFLRRRFAILLFGTAPIRWPPFCLALPLSFSHPCPEQAFDAVGVHRIHFQSLSHLAPGTLGLFAAQVAAALFAPSHLAPTGDLAFCRCFVRFHLGHLDS